MAISIILYNLQKALQVSYCDPILQWKNIDF